MFSPNFSDRFLLIFKKGYLFDYNFESFDFGSLDSLFHQLSVDIKFVKF